MWRNMKRCNINVQYKIVNTGCWFFLGGGGWLCRAQSCCKLDVNVILGTRSFQSNDLNNRSRYSWFPAFRAERAVRCQN